MERIIEFRGKHIHSFIEPQEIQKWVYGYLIDYNYINSKELGGEVLVNPSTIGQFTGLLDKDGKKIFEKDIIEITRPCVFEKGVVIFESGCYFIKTNTTLLPLYEGSINFDLKIIRKYMGG